MMNSKKWSKLLTVKAIKGYKDVDMASKSIQVREKEKERPWLLLWIQSIGSEESKEEAQKNGCSWEWENGLQSPEEFKVTKKERKKWNLF